MGVEVVEFDFLTPEAVADYCYSRGYLQVAGAPFCWQYPDARLEPTADAQMLHAAAVLLGVWGHPGGAMHLLLRHPQAPGLRGSQGGPGAALTCFFMCWGAHW